LHFGKHWQEQQIHGTHMHNFDLQQKIIVPEIQQGKSLELLRIYKNRVAQMP